MLALQENCIHPETKKTYVKNARGGKDNSAEGLQVSALVSLSSPALLQASCCPEASSSGLTTVALYG